MINAPNTIALYKIHRRKALVRWLSILGAAPLAAVVLSPVMRPTTREAAVGIAVVLAVAAMIYARYLFTVWRIESGKFGSWKFEALGLARFAMRRRVGA